MPNLNVNTTLSTAESTFTNKTYFDRELLAQIRTRFVHAKYAKKKNIPPNSGKKVEWRKWHPFDPELARGGLEEGVTPDGMEVSQDKVEAEVKQFGAFITISDLMDRTAIDDLMGDAPEMLAEQLGTVIDWLTRDEMASGTQVIYAHADGVTPTKRSEVTKDCVITMEDVRLALLTLKKAKARKFNGTEFGTKRRGEHFICICSPESIHHLQNDEWWKDVSKYQNQEAIYTGELGKMFDIVFVESTEGKVFEGEGASGADVHATVVFGKDSYATAEINGSGSIKSYIKGFGSAGTADPLNQRATVGAKVMAYAAKILEDAHIVRIESGSNLM